MNDSGVSLLLQHWSRSAIAPRPPVTMAEIAAFELEHAVRLPREIRDYYLAADGFDEQDQNGFSFWPLARVSRLSAFDGGRWSFGADDCFLFADYLSLCWGYAFCLNTESGGTRFCIVGTANGQPLWIADGFREFVDLYLRDDERLYPARDSD